MKLEPHRLMVMQAIVLACAEQLAQFDNPYRPHLKGSPADKAFQEMRSAVKAMKRERRAR
jgi:hypothetical protein